MNVVNDLEKLEIYFKSGVENLKKYCKKLLKKIIRASKVSIKNFSKSYIF